MQMKMPPRMRQTTDAITPCYRIEQSACNLMARRVNVQSESRKLASNTYLGHDIATGKISFSSAVFAFTCLFGCLPTFWMLA